MYFSPFFLIGFSFETGLGRALDARPLLDSVLLIGLLEFLVHRRRVWILNGPSGTVPCRSHDAFRNLHPNTPKSLSHDLMQATRGLVNGRYHVLVVTSDGKRGFGSLDQKFRHPSICKQLEIAIRELVRPFYLVAFLPTKA